MQDINTKDAAIAAFDSAGLEYAIVDAENPENDIVIPATGLPDPEAHERAREDAFQRVAHNVRMKLAQSIINRREAENKRAARTRQARSRRKERLAKASRKRNR